MMKMLACKELHVDSIKKFGCHEIPLDNSSRSKFDDVSNRTKEVDKF